MSLPFSLILNKLLQTKNVKKVELARKIGVKSQTTISNWLNGVGAPDWNQLIKMKEVFGLNDIRELFGLESGNCLTITKEEYDKAIMNARLEEAREIAMGKKTEKSTNKSSVYSSVGADRSKMVKSR